MDEPQRTIRICEQHGVPLYLLGCVLTSNEDDAATVVANAIGQGHDGPAAADLRDEPDARRRLARLVYLEGTRHCGPSARTRLTAPGDTGCRGSLPPVVQWLMRLPTQQRDVIALCMFGGHTYREAADLMNIEAQQAVALMRDGCARTLARRRTRSYGASTRPETSRSSGRRNGRPQPDQSAAVRASNPR